MTNSQILIRCLDFYSGVRLPDGHVVGLETNFIGKTHPSLEENQSPPKSEFMLDKNRCLKT